jgi:fibronectin type 3 domain-containing protein
MEAPVRAYIAMLGAMLVGTLTTGANAQVVKPRNPPVAAGRLPAPAKITASQQPDGKIRVVWSSVENATKYALIRSVPPTPQAAVALPNPSDTEYVDTDVTPGSFYYYVVAADNEDRVGGMKASAPPVKAVAQVALRETGDTGTTADGTGAGGAIPAPSNVIVKPYPYTQVTVSWGSSREGTYYLVERQQQGARKQGWEPIAGPIWRHHAGSFWRCCEATDRTPPQNAGVVYRVTALDTLPPNYRSRSVESKPLFVWTVKVEPPVVDAQQLAEGTTKRFTTGRFEAANLERVQWISLDPEVASVDDRGFITAAPKYAGYVTYIVATGKIRSGGVQSFIWRIEVVKPVTTAGPS